MTEPKLLAVRFEVEDDMLDYLAWHQKKYGFKTMADSARWVLNTARRSDNLYIIEEKGVHQQ